MNARRSTGVKFATVQFVLLVLLVSSYFVQIEVVEISARSLNIYHVITLLSIGFVILYTTASGSTKIGLSSFALFAFVISMIVPAMVSWHFSMSNVLLVFAAMSFLIGLTCGNLDDVERRRIYQISVGIFIAAVVVRNLLHLADLGVIYSRSRGCDSCFLATGGRNIEATMFALLALLYRGKRRFLLGAAMTATVALFQSRIGLIGALIFWISYVSDRRASWRTMIMLVAVHCALVVVIIAPDLPILDRFNVADEVSLGQKGLGRLALWNAALQLIPANPFGVGPGNAVTEINARMGLGFWENNIHNVYLTWILELGWLHGWALVAFVFWVLIRSRRIPEFYAVLYLALGSLFEFTGYDAAYWFFLGLAFSATRQRTATRDPATLTPPRRTPGSRDLPHRSAPHLRLHK